MKKVISLNDFIYAGQKFIKMALIRLSEQGISVDESAIDHLCFRVRTLGEYKEYTDFLHSHGVLLTEVSVNGRLISTFKLTPGFRIGAHAVTLVEIPEPKSGHSYPTAFEHFEVVIQESFDAFRQRHRNVSFAPIVQKGSNSELCLKFDIFQVKFHHQSLEQIIKMENL